MPSHNTAVIVSQGPDITSYITVASSQSHVYLLGLGVILILTLDLLIDMVAVIELLLVFDLVSLGVLLILSLTVILGVIEGDTVTLGVHGWHNSCPLLGLTLFSILLLGLGNKTPTLPFTVLIFEKMSGIFIAIILRWFRYTYAWRNTYTYCNSRTYTFCWS